MRIEKTRLPRESFREFVGRHDLALELVEEANQWRASFRGVEIKEGSMLRGVIVRGVSVVDAARVLMHAISQQLIVVDAYKPTRREIAVPILWMDAESEMEIARAD